MPVTTVFGCAESLDEGDEGAPATGKIVWMFKHDRFIVLLLINGRHNTIHRQDKQGKNREIR